MTRPRTEAPRLYRGLLVVAALSAVAVTALLAVATHHWVGSAFPGFFVLPNRVIPSVGRPGWPAGQDGALYQQTVVAVDGARVRDNGDVYAEVGARAPGSAIDYTLRRGAASATLTIASRTFSRADYLMIFGTYLVTGFLYLALGLLGTWVLGEAPLGRALLYLGGIAGIYALSAASIYGSQADMRLHALAEAFFPAALVYVGCVFPKPRGRWAMPVVAAAWWLSLALAIPYQLLLWQPAAYSLLHAACEVYLGLAGLALGARLILARARAKRPAPLLRAAVAGALLGLGVPAIVLTLSGVSGGALPVNVCTATAFLFPLCLGYGIVRLRWDAYRLRAAAVVG